MSKNVYKFYWDCGRSGNLEGVFVATEQEINALIGKRAYFGEVLGKHSEVYGEIEEGDIKKIDIDPNAVEEVTKHLGETWSGFNPLEYVELTCGVCGYEGIAEEFENICNEICCECKEKQEEGGEE
ncbi:hypothetical protein CN892_27400 [Bacillus anthracis]|nr:hypothetical protein CN892_27400 [Bacillus anthracis]